jgi:Zn ribbon nucleic-acid-binding protein
MSEKRKIIGSEQCPECERITPVVVIETHGEKLDKLRAECVVCGYVFAHALIGDVSVEGN